MADARVGRAVLTLELDDSQAREGLRNFLADSKKAGDAIKGIGQAIDLKVFTEFGRLATEAVMKIAEGITYLGERGSAVSDVSDSFGILSRRAGETAELMIGQLRAGVVGSINDFDLMTLANKALGAGLIRNSEDMGTLAAGARALGKATGVDTKEAFETLTSAIASGRTAQLKQLGLFVDSKVAVEAFAEANHRAAGDLTDAERAQALSAATLDALRGRLKAIVPDAADFGEMLASVKVRLENFRDQVAVAISQSPVLRAGLEAIGKALDQNIGTNQAQAVQIVVRAVERLAIDLALFAEGAVEAARFVANAWNLLEYAFNAVLAAVVNVSAAIYEDVIAPLSELSAKLSILESSRQAFRRMATDARQTGADLRAMGDSFTQQANEVLDKAAAETVAFDAARSVLSQLRAGMEATAASGATLAATGPQMAAGFQQAGGAATLTAAQVKALEDQAAASANAMIATKALIANTYMQLEQQLTLAQKTGLDRRLAELEIAKNAELAKIQSLAFEEPAQYEAMTARIVALYGLQAQAAAESFAAQSASASNHRMTAEQQALAQLATARAMYESIRASGVATEETLQRAHQAMADAEEHVDEIRHKNKLQRMDDIAAATSTVLRSVFGKNKAAAIAAALIDVAAAIVKTLAQLGWWGIPAAAAIAAQGYAQVNQIRSQGGEGFAEGTPGLDFANFGRVSFAALHNQEAVIPRGRGHLLAGEIAQALPGAGGQDLVEVLRRIEQALADQPSTLARALRMARLQGA